MKIVIIGAGIGGLALANLLAHDGHDVHVYEQRAAPGGRAGLLEQDGFRFDTGPSWYLMPEVFRRYYELLDESVEAQLELTRLSPAYKVFFETQPAVTITSDLANDSKTFEAIESGAGQALKRYVRAGDTIYRLSLDKFLYSNFSRLGDILNRTTLKYAPNMVRLAATPLHSYVKSFVKDRRLQQILEYPMVFLGTSPFKAPAIYSLMSSLDFREGVFYPRGGMYTLIESLVRIGRKKGVSYHFNTTVARIDAHNDAATGISLDSGAFVQADVVVSNADLHFNETRLLSSPYQSYPAAYWQNKEPGPSALLLYLGIKGKIPELGHHNLLFVDAWRQNFDDIYKNRKAPDPASIYVCKASETDSSVAPQGCENVFVLVPLPAGNSIANADIPKLKERYLTQIKTMTGADLTKHVVTKAEFTPHDFSTEFNAWKSSMLGQSHRLRQSAFFRTPNKSKKLKNLYYVGANTVPGIGLPMCLIGAELVRERIKGMHP